MFGTNQKIQFMSGALINGHLPDDIIQHISTFLFWYEFLSFTMVTTKVQFQTKNYRQCEKQRLMRIQKNICMALHDHPSCTGSIAKEWGHEIVSYFYAHPPSIQIGTICEGMDYLGAWSVCTILATRWSRGDSSYSHLYHSFVPSLHARTTEDIMECGEMANFEPFYKEYYVRFHGWSPQWNEWITREKIATLGTYTINPWKQSCTFTRQWIIQEMNTGRYNLSIMTLHKYPPRCYPPTDVLIRCFVQRSNREFQSVNMPTI